MPWPVIAAGIGKLLGGTVVPAIGKAVLGGVTGGIASRIAGKVGGSPAYAQAGPDMAAQYGQVAFATAANQQAEAAQAGRDSNWIEAQERLAAFQAALSDQASDKAFERELAIRQQEFAQAVALNQLTDASMMRRLREMDALERGRVPPPGIPERTADAFRRHFSPVTESPGLRDFLRNFPFGPE